jgi:hypothetical protein
VTKVEPPGRDMMEDLDLGGWLEMMEGGILAEFRQNLAHQEKDRNISRIL